MITDSRSTRVRFTTTKRESENEIHHRTFRSLLISISPSASKRALLYFTSPYFRRFKFEWWRRTGETSPSPEKSRERNTSLWPCFRHGDRARTENPGNHPHRPSPNRPRSNTDTSLSLCVCNSTAKLCKHIGTRTIFEKIFSKSLENPSSSPVFFFFFPLPHRRRTTTEPDLSDYCVRLLNARIIGQSVFWGERFGDAVPEIGKWGWLVVRQAASVYARFGELNTVRGK